MTKLKNNNQDRTLTKLAMGVLIAFAMYLLYLFIPIWSMDIAKASTNANVLSIEKDGGINRVIYTYYHERLKKDIKLSRKVELKSYLERIERRSSMKIDYSIHFPGYVHFHGLDSKLSPSLTITVFLLVLLSIYLCLRVLQGKLELKTLLGMQN